VRTLPSLGFAAGLLLCGCSDPWQVLHPGTDGAFAGQKTFRFESVDASGTLIDGEAESAYISEDEEVAEEWQRAKATVLKRFPAALEARLREHGIALGTSGPNVVAKLSAVTLAELVTVDDNPNYLKTTLVLDVTVSDGSASEEVRIEQSAIGFATKPIEQRVGEVGDSVGVICGDYLGARASD
jgi:hypothetical protein